MEEFPEPPGCRVQPGFVKNNPKNNALYLQRSIEAIPEWETYLTDIDAYLQGVLPGYNIVQIKAKFGELRYYWNAPPWAAQEYVEYARRVVGILEARASDLQ